MHFDAENRNVMQKNAQYCMKTTHKTYQIHADLVVSADDAFALVDVVLAPEAVEALRTFAVKIVARISLVLGDDTLTPVLTGLLHACVVRGVAGRTHELGCAGTGEVVDLKITKDRPGSIS